MDPREDFDDFYRVHVRAVLAYFARRVDSPEVAADLTAETFAAALASRDRFDPARGEAGAWLFGIARHELQRMDRRGRVEIRLRRRLGIETPVAHHDALRAIERLGSSGIEDALASLAPAHRDAVRARIIEERDYADIARSQSISPDLARQRVSRGLAALRARLTGREQL